MLGLELPRTLNPEARRLNKELKAASATDSIKLTVGRNKHDVPGDMKLEFGNSVIALNSSDIIAGRHNNKNRSVFKTKVGNVLVELDDHNMVTSAALVKNLGKKGEKVEALNVDNSELKLSAAKFPKFLLRTEELAALRAKQPGEDSYGVVRKERDFIAAEDRDVLEVVSAKGKITKYDLQRRDTLAEFKERKGESSGDEALNYAFDQTVLGMDLSDDTATIKQTDSGTVATFVERSIASEPRTISVSESDPRSPMIRTLKKDIAQSVDDNRPREVIDGIPVAMPKSQIKFTPTTEEKIVGHLLDLKRGKGLAGNGYRLEDPKTGKDLLCIIDDAGNFTKYTAAGKQTTPSGRVITRFSHPSQKGEDLYFEAATNKTYKYFDGENPGERVLKRLGKIRSVGYGNYEENIAEIKQTLTNSNMIVKQAAKKELGKVVSAELNNKLPYNRKTFRNMFKNLKNVGEQILTSVTHTIREL